MSTETVKHVQLTRELLKETLQEALTDEAVASASKKFKDAIAELHYDFEYSVQSNLAYNLAYWTQRMFEDAFRAMLNGDEDLMRKHLLCKDGGWTGRDGRHSVIHGRLFEGGAIEMRRKIVDAYPELLKNERILDLEDQVKSLVQQVNKAEADVDRLRRGEL